MFRVPKGLATVAGIVSLLLAVSALGGVAAALWLNPKPALALLGFEIVSLVAAVLGVLFWMGKFHDGPGLALACVAGTILVASGLGFMGSEGQIGSISLRPYLLARIAGTGILGLLAAHCVLSRHPRAWPLAIKGGVAGLPVVGVLAAGAFLARTGRLSPLLAGQGMAMKLIVGTIAAVVLGTLLCISVHLLVKAFELGRERSAPGQCPRCGYDLKGLNAGVCPECGASVAATGTVQIS